ncbi:MAG: hypothetical protein JWO52_5105 [Gammaproteobacteria bacterium]|nr:hypothetical protein [Gammaproteobacteria bacterium]
MNKFLAVITVICIAACGGSGGEVTPVPLSLSDVTPAKGATAVLRTAAIVLSFSAPLDAATLSASTVTLAGPAGSQPIGLSAAGNKLTVTPSSGLSPLTPYTLTIGVGLRGSAGEQLAGPVMTGFTTGDRQWQTAVPIETGDVSIAENPQIAINARGDAAAVWRRLDGQVTRTWSNRYTAGSGWGTAVAIGPDMGPAAPGPVRNPQVAIDANGNALAVWPQADGGNIRIWSNHYTTGMGWGTAGSIEVNASTGASDVSAVPQIKFDANGNSIALWERSDGVHSRVWSNRYTVGAGWNTAAIPIDDNGGEAGSAQIAFDANGDAIAVWDQLDNAGFHIWASRYTAAAGSWSTAQMIQSDDVVQAFGPQIGIDRAGNALVVWNQSHGAMQTEIWANRYAAANGGWGTAGRISDTAGGAGTPHIATDANGDALVVWPQFDNSTSSSVRWNRYTASTGWGTAAQIEPGNGTYVWDPQIACDPSGNALLVWDRADSVHSEIRSSRYTVSGGWAASVNAGSTGDVLYPVIVIDLAGNALALWQQSDGSHVSFLWANRFE